jgi:hypothetical protein
MRVQIPYSHTIKVNVFVDDIKIFYAIKSPHGCSLLQSDTDIFVDLKKSLEKSAQLTS